MSFFKDLIDPLDFFGTKSNEEAANLTRQSSEDGLKLQREMFDALRRDGEPVRTERDIAIDRLRGINNGTFTPQSGPGLDYRISEQTGDVRQLNAARGKLNSGENAIQEQNVAARLTADDFNQSTNRLLNLAGFSTDDLNQNNALLQNNINQQSNQLFNIGQARANGIIGEQNARNRAANSLAFMGGYFGG